MFPNFYSSLLQAGLPVISATDDGKAEFSRGLTDQEMLVYFSIVDPVEYALLQKQLGAKGRVANIPGWATWTPAEAQAWYDSNIGTPLQADIPASVTLANIRPILVAMLNTMRAMGTMLWALGRIALALRDDRWP